MKTNNFATIKITGREIYLVVIEKRRLGFIVKSFDTIYAAESYAIALISDITPYGNRALNEMLRLYRPMVSYQVMGNTYYLTKSLSSHHTAHFDAYVVPVNEFKGGISLFVKEREHCSDFLSYGDHFKRYYRAINQFKEFGFLAN